MGIGNGNDIGILISALLDVNKSASDINGKQIKQLQEKLDKLKIKIDIDDKVLAELSNFSKSIEKMNLLFEKSNETIKKNVLITKELDGSTKTVVQDMKRTGEIVETTTTKINKQTEAVQKQVKATLDLAKAEEFQASHTDRYKGGNPTGTTDVYKQDNTTRTVIQSGDNETREIIKQDFELAKKMSVQKMDLIHKEALEMNKVYDNSVKAFSEAEQRKRNEIKQTALLDSKENNRVQKEKYDNMLKEAYSMNKDYDKQRNVGIKNESQFRDYTNKQDVEFAQKFQTVLNQNLGIKEKEILTDKKRFDYEQMYLGLLDKEKTKVNDLALYKQKMLGGNGFSGELEIFADKQKNKYDKSAYDKLVKDVKALNIDTPELNDKIKQTGIEFSSLRQQAAESGNVMTRAMENAGKFLRFYLVGGLLVGAVNALKSSVGYVVELDNSLNQIRIVTGQSQQEVQKLANSYNNLAKEMSVTTSEIASEAANLFRQGLGETEVEARMKAIIQYAKISSISMADSDKIITATANATGESVNKIIDIFALLGDSTSSGAEEIGEALQKVASAAENSGLSLEKSSSWIATISSITRDSASTIGRSLNSIISRYESIKSTGFNSEDTTKINDVTASLSALGITATDSAGQLKPIADVVDILGTKWDMLTKNEKSYIATTMAGTFQRNKFITLMDNYKDSLTNYETALNSAGTSQKKFDIYQESSAAKIDKLKSTLEGLTSSMISSDFLKGAVDFGTEFLNVIDRVTTSIGGIGSALLVLIPIIITKFLTSLITIKTVEGILTVSTIGLTTAIKGLGVALTTLATNPITWLVVALGLVVTGIVSYTNSQQKLKEQTEANTKSQADFNKTIKEFNESLDPKKIDEVTASLEKLKEVTNYDENIEKIKKLREEIEKLQNSNTQIKVDREGSSFSYGSNDQAISEKLKQLSELEKQTGQTTKAIEEANKAQKLSTAMDYESVQSSIRKTASKIQEISADKQLLQQYNESVKKGKEDLNIKKLLVDKYPEFIGGIDETTGTMKLNTTALGDNLDAQKSLQLAQIVTAQVAMTESNKTVETLINNTKTEIETINDRISILKELKSAYESAYNSSDESDEAKSRRDKTAVFYGFKIDEAQQEAKKLAEKYNRLNITDGIQKNFLKSSPEELLKSYSGEITGKTPPKTDEKGSKYTPSTEESALKALYDANKISLEEYYNRLLKLENSLYKGYSNKSAKQIEDGLRSKNEDIAKKMEGYLSLKGNITGTKDLIDKASLDKISLLFTQADEKLQKFSDSLSLLGNIDTTEEKAKEIEIIGDRLTEASKELVFLQSEIKKLNSLKLLTSQQQAQLDLYKDREMKVKVIIVADREKLEADATSYAQSLVENEKKASELNAEKDYNNKLKASEDSIYGIVGQKAFETSAQKRIDSYNDQIEALETQDNILKEQIERQERLLDISKAQLEISNISNQRDTKIIRQREDGSYYTSMEANPQKLRESQEKLADLKTDFASWEHDNDIRHQRERLQILINGEQSILDDKRKKYEEGKILLDESLEQAKNAIEIKYLDIETLVLEKLKGINEKQIEELETFVGDLKTQADSAEAQWQRLYASSKGIETPSATDTSVNTTSSSNSINQKIVYDPKIDYSAQLDKMPKTTANKSEYNDLVDKRIAKIDDLGLDPNLKSKYKKYAEGGKVDYTGLAWVDGTPSKPEGFLKNMDMTNLLKVVDITRSIIPTINSFKMPQLNNTITSNGTTQTFHVKIEKVETQDAESFINLLPTLVHQYKK